MRTTLDDLLASKSDFELVNGVADRLERAEEAVGALPSRDAESAVVLTWRAASSIEVGGFRFLFESSFVVEDPGCERTIAGFRALELNQIVRVFEEVLAWFPGSRPPLDEGERLAVLAAVPREADERASAAVRSSRALLRERLAGYIRAHRPELEQALGDHEARRREPVAAAKTWDVGGRAPEDVASALTEQLRALEPGKVLALVTTHRGTSRPIGGGEELAFTTARWLRAFSAMTGNALVRAEPPRYSIRRGELMEASLEAFERRGARRDPERPRAPSLLPAIDTSKLPGVVVILVALVLLLRLSGVVKGKRPLMPPEPAVRFLGSEPAGLRFELTAKNLVRLSQIEIPTGLVKELHASLPAGFELGPDADVPDKTVHWYAHDSVVFGPRTIQLVIPCRATGTERGTIAFHVSEAKEPIVVEIGGSAVTSGR